MRIETSCETGHERLCLRSASLGRTDHEILRLARVRDGPRTQSRAGGGGVFRPLIESSPDDSRISSGRCGESQNTTHDFCESFSVLSKLFKSRESDSILSLSPCGDSGTLLLSGTLSTTLLSSWARCIAYSDKFEANDLSS